MGKRETNLSLIIPAYNEQKIIKKTLSKVLAFLYKKKYKYEVIVVDDGSTDNTFKLVQKFNKKSVKFLRLTKNSGKGAALREGVLASKGKYVLYSDCDLSVPIENIDKFMKRLEKDADLVIGSRRVVGSYIKVHQPLIRESMGRVFTFLTRKVLQTDLSDFTCGFKGYRGDIARKLYKKSVINRWAYDSEILFLAKKSGFVTVELPVEWFNRADSRVNLKKVVIESFMDLIKIRVNYTKGLYN